MLKISKGILFATTALGLGLTAPEIAAAQAQAQGQNTTVMQDVIVTARRVEERLQDVPISITVFDQEQLANNNVTSAKDLTLYTPSLQTNNRYAGDNTTFTIRGFTQEQRTYSTVGTFFADVVMPRGSGATQGGDGAGPGALFDLQNVQVLKGPQGTLFGRNVTGGAVLLVPNKPTDRLEGYLEGSVGDYDLRRMQGVLNAPLNDSFRIRLGVDRMKRDGYLRNIGAFGDGRSGNHGMGNVDYWAGRLSAVLDITPDLENYTIASFTQSKNNAAIPKTTKCYPAAVQALGANNVLRLGQLSCDQMAREAQHGFWTISNRIPDSVSITETWQIINTTTWSPSANLTVKNIFSYGEFRGTTNIELFGNYWLTGAVAGQETSPNQVNGFAFTSAEASKGYTNAQSSLVEELQFQGQQMDDRFIWQAGLYMEINDPIGFSGVQTATFAPCADIASFNCLGPTPNQSVGTGSFSVAKTKFRDYAAYGQGSYDLTDQLKLTAGLRYTKDEVRTVLHNETMLFGNPPNAATVRFRCSNPTAAGYSGLTTYPFTAEQRFDVCGQNLEKNTSAWTWLLDLDYKPTDDVMLYAKWSRGYRQGGLAIFGPDPIQPFDAEKVDTYEVGAKTSWRGDMPGYFNIAGYYNDFRDQQLQFGVACVSSLPGFTVPCAGNAAILNAGSSELYGVEVELGVSPFDGLRLDVSYGFMKSKLKEIDIPAAGSLPPYNSFTPPVVGDVIANAGPENKVVVSANYTLPLAESVGQVSVGGTYVYQDAYRSVVDGVPGSGNGILPSANILNLNANWQDIAGRPVDASFFITNVTNEHVYLHANDNQLRGFVSYFIGEPRMYGVRLRYKFGG
ncbi:TonB-dependent receptor [Phenylobacterium sp. LjRoot219]|uniref:TonB-dependent receptor n=1 Tax=Phenylobacterium sp. LjRoot219 TaxID=3342283 RepID=UPI003ECDB2B1